MTTPAERTRAVLDMERYVRDLWLYQDGKSSRALVPRYLITAIDVSVLALLATKVHPAPTAPRCWKSLTR